MLKLLLTYFRRNSLKKPISYIIFVTNKCNARCQHCFNWQNLNILTERELSFLELERFSKNIGKIYSMGFSGGEPFLRDDLLELLLLFSERNRPAELEVPTNGLIPERIASVFEKVLMRRFPTEYSINLSLDGFRETHDEIRGVQGNFKKAVETYHTLVPLRKKYGLKIKVTTVLNNKNIHEIAQFSDFIKKEMPEINFHNFEIMRGSPKDSSLHPPGVNELLELCPTIFKAWNGYEFYNTRLKSYIATYLKQHIFNTYIEILHRKKQVVPCLAYSFNAVLYADGEVGLCELTPPIGNIRDKPFTEILKSDKARIIRSSILNKECYCTHSCFMQKSIFLNLWQYRKLLLKNYTQQP